jgi:hypothetical protein
MCAEFFCRVRGLLLRIDTGGIGWPTSCMHFKKSALSPTRTLLA